MPDLRRFRQSSAMQQLLFRESKLKKTRFCGVLVSTSLCQGERESSILFRTAKPKNRVCKAHEKSEANMPISYTDKDKSEIIDHKMQLLKAIDKAFYVSAANAVYISKLLNEYDFEKQNGEEKATQMWDTLETCVATNETIVKASDIMRAYLNFLNENLEKIENDKHKGAQ